MILRVFVAHLILINGIFSQGWCGVKYWTDRYPELGYSGDYPGFYNDQTDYREYKRKTSGDVSKECNYKEKDKSEKDRSHLLVCGKKPDDKITIFQQKHFTTIDELSFHKDTKEISISFSNLAYIHRNAFKTLKNLEKLTIIGSFITAMPDLTENQKLEAIDFYDNRIEIFRGNYTLLPKSLKWITLIKNQIDKLPDRYFDLPKLQYIALAQNQMRYIPGNAFWDVLNLEYAGFDQNSISSISRQDLENLAKSKKFVHLNVSNNQISYMAPYAFKTLKKLKVLELQNNQIETVRKNVLWKIPELLHLELNKNRIKTLSSQFITDCENLKVLLLHSQQEKYKLDTIYFDSLKNLQKLESLYLGSNQLTRFPHPVFYEDDSPDVVNLYLDNNQLSTLRDYSGKDFPASAQVYHLLNTKEFKPFKRMTKLQKLELQNNLIKEIQATDLEYANTLNVLNLEGNYLQELSIHENAFRNTSLSTVYFSKQNGASIQYVPRALTANRLKDLTNVYLDGNKITYILNGTFGNLPRLQCLYLSQNNIIAIEDGAFPVSLKGLYLSGNKFRFKNQKQFNGLTNLEILDLKFNNIDVLPNHALLNLPKLKSLYLQGNEIGRLLKVHFQDTPQLEIIKLQDNKIAYIEDGTFATIKRKGNKEIILLNLERNQLSKIPLTDFWNVKLNELKLKNNLIIEVQSNAFVNVSRVGSSDCVIDLHYNRLERILEYAFNNVDCYNIKIGGKEKLSGNRIVPYNPLLKEIRSYAYYNVKVGELDLSYSSVQNIPEYAFKLNGLGETLHLNNGKLQSISSFAFDLGFINGDIDLSSSNLIRIGRKIFAKGTSFKNLYLHNNTIEIIMPDAFDGATMRGYLNLNNNSLKEFPKAISVFTSLTKLFLQYNKIEELPAGTFDSFTELDELIMNANNLKRLPKNVFRKNRKLKFLKMESNPFEIIEDDAFSFEGESSMIECRLQYQPRHGMPRLSNIEHIPQFQQRMPHLQFFLTSGVHTMAPDVFNDKLPKMNQMSFDTAVLQCDCQFYDTIMKYLASGKDTCYRLYGTECRQIKCVAPAALNGFNRFRRNDQSIIRNRKHDFICSPEKIIVTAPVDYTIQIDYSYPNLLFAEGTPITTSHKLYFEATCILQDDTSSQVLKASVVNKKRITITGNRVIPGRNYKCHSTMTFTKDGVNKTSARTKKILVTTLERKDKVSLCANGDPYECKLLIEHEPCKIDGCDQEASSSLRPSTCDSTGCCNFCYKTCVKCNNTVKATMKLNITYYDFPVDDADFSAREYKPDDCCPNYIPSPYETWLARRNTGDPTKDSFSEWFRATSSRNIPINEVLTLAHEEGDNDPVSRRKMFTFWEGNYWPVNGKGFKAQDQRDCDGKELLNLGFTSAVRTGFTFRGTEYFQFAGGEDLWVYINKILVLHIISHDPKNSTITCKTFRLENVTGYGLIVPSVGEVDPVLRSCINTRELPDEAVSLRLMPNINYGLDVFHVERFKCSSQFLFRTSGVYFITGIDLMTTKPRIDYLSFPPEDAHKKSIIADIILTDQYGSVPPYTVTIQSGNEEERFEIVENSTTAHENAAKVPPPKVYKNVTLYGEHIIICSNATVTSGKINKTSTIPQVFAGINTKSALILLKNYLDYESTAKYLLKITVTDSKGVVGVGHIAVQILVSDQSDNCPIIKEKSRISLHPAPPLSPNSLMKIIATDLDSGNNGRITYIVGEITSKIPTIESKSYNVTSDIVKGGVTVTTSKIVFVNTTTQYLVTLNLFAVDNGNPRRGDFFSISISYHPSCDKTGKLKVNATSGELYFFAPGMTNYNKTKLRYGEEECYECEAGYSCQGDGMEVQCVQNKTTKHYYSYGFQTKCSPCPEGWLCHNGIIIKCAPNTYVKCNDTWCPNECFPCEKGTYCYDGVSITCKPGMFSDGKGPCKICRPGSFTNVSRSSSCLCCPAGFESTNMKDGCQECNEREYSPGDCSICQSCLPPGSCACGRNPCFKGVKCYNIGAHGSLYKCGRCPDGFEGDGETCVDVDECKVNPCVHKCINLSPGFKCTGCKVGYHGNSPAGVGIEQAQKMKQVCEDINECEDSSLHFCDPNAACINTKGSYTCGKCNPGFVGDGYAGCRSGDYCGTGRHNCGENATCIPLGTEKFYCECIDGFAGDGIVCELDDDYDGVSNTGAACSILACKEDRCPTTPNGGQEDNDIDALGDVCDDDDDDDNKPDKQDNCQFQKNRSTLDSDGDGFGDECDNCKSIYNRDQADLDNDGKGDVCDDDIDGDGIPNTRDACRYSTNPDMIDDDKDGVPNICDNCYKHPNLDQADLNKNGFGDICDGPGQDTDGDSIPNDYDNCPNTPNADQADTDSDGKGDFCDDDKDGDGVKDEDDNCVYVSNPAQEHTSNYDMAANPVGTACVDDYDGDTFNDQIDTCPYSPNLHVTSFKNHMLVDLADSTSTEPKPKWHISNKGRDIEQFERTLRPTMLIGNERFSEVSYSGVLHVNNDKGIDYFGIVFGYQSNKKFYIVIWRHENLNYLNKTYKAGIKGIQIKLVNSRTGPSQELTEALWHSGDTKNQVTLLWHDPKMMGWKHRTPYIFNLEFRPSVGRIRFLIKQGQNIITDSGYIYNTMITGGQLGVYTHGQWNTIWARLEARCLQRLNKALLFNGASTCASLPSPKQLNIINSFTVGVWIKLPAADPESTDPFPVFPLVCNTDKTICLSIKDSILEGKIKEITVQGTTKLKLQQWYFLSMRYDAQERYLDIYENAVSVGRVKVPFIILERNKNLFLGCDGVNYFKGMLDELVIWNVYLSQRQITEYMKLVGLVWPRHQRIVAAHYTFDQAPSSQLIDQSEYKNNGNVTSASWVESSLDEARFKIIYPNNYRKKRYAHLEL